jgi:hypothetical protein
LLLATSLLVSLALALALAGCGDSGSKEQTTTKAAAEQSPGAALKSLLAAAHDGDESKIRSLLVPGSPASLAPELVDGLGSFPLQTPVILSVQIDGRFAVAAIAGPRTAEGMKERYAAYAVALKRVGNNGYRASIVSPVQIDPLGPDTGSAQSSITQVAAQFSAPKRLVQAGLWVDGKAVAADPRGSSKKFTAFGATPKLQPGWHSVVAFAEAGGSATARAWTFRVK